MSKIRLIPYSETPQVTGLEYSEMRDVKDGKITKKEAEAIAESRKWGDRKYRLKDGVRW